MLKWNVVANLAGRGWATAMGILFVPLYIKFMGIEAYGLVGFYATLQAVFMRLDMGLSATLNREMARRAGDPEEAEGARDLLRTLEVIYWSVAIVIGIVVVALAPLLAHRWVKAEELSPATVQQAVVIMGLVLALQWPSALYEGGLRGLQRQVLWNAINVGCATLRGVGAILILWRVSPTILAFFAWQIVTTGLQTLLMAHYVWRSMPVCPKRPAFRKTCFQQIWRFAAGMSGISLLSLLLTQSDKIIVSKVLPLETLGYYTLAGVVAGGLYMLIGPVFEALYPRFTQLVAANDEAGLRSLYHRAAQLMSVLVLPTAAVLAFFATELLRVWTHNPEAVANAHLLVTLLVIGSAFNGLMHPPYGVQLAYAWTSLNLYANIVSVVVFVPLMVFMATRYGAVGAASVWPMLNGAALLTTQHFMHRRHLQGEKWRWYFEDIALPMAAAVVIAGCFRLFVPADLPTLSTVAALAAVSAATLAGTAWVTPATRGWIRKGLPALAARAGSRA